MSRAYTALAFLSLAALCSTALAADPPSLQWSPSESYTGGTQYDPRLDKPVKLWGAGMPLKQVFTDLTAQTGVDVTCFPEGDVNERVCLNAYLNPDTPPDLRSVLSQVSWVTDCAITTSGEGEARNYYLMSTSVGGEDVIAELEKEEGSGERARRSRNACHPSRP